MKNRVSLAVLTVSIALAVMMPTTESIWIDEAQTWSHVAAPSVPEMFRNLSANVYSEALMPLSMLIAWIFGKLLGTSEWALRAPNILWTVVALLAFVRVGRRWNAPWAPLLFVVQPFVWFYANEARPYALQIALGAWTVALTLEAVQERVLRQHVWLGLLATSVLLIATSLFGVITVGPVALVVAYFVLRGEWRLPPKWQLSLGACALVVSALGAYYFLTLQRGAAGTKIWNPGLSNIAFAIYEFGGFTGFGPGRDQLREIVRSSGIRAILEQFTPALLPIGLLAVAYAAIIWQLILDPSRKQRRLVYTAAFLLGSVAIATALLSLIAKFPFWGRHIAPVFPAFLMLLVFSLHQRMERSPRNGWLLTAGICALLLISSFQLRFATRHRKDDYRTAATFAREALSEGKTTWWAADPAGARYYGADEGRSGSFSIVTNHNVKALTSASPPPDAIVFSKPDIYDESGLIRKLLDGGKFRIARTAKAFTVWERE